MTEETKLHYNVPQLLFYLIRASINVLLWGRGTGKTEGPMALFTLENIHSMPKSNGGLIGATYEQLLTRTIPGLIAGWERLGYIENVHFWVRKFPPEELRVPRGYRRPLKADHFITWYNGSGIYLISLDRPATGNGLSLDWLAGDEARFLNHKKLVELYPVLRGNSQHFGDLSNHRSILFCSDMPKLSKEKWLLEFKEQMDKAVIEMIINCQVKLMQIQEKLTLAAPTYKAVLEGQAKTLELSINALRMNETYFSVASSLDNVHALGIDAIKQMRRVLTDLDYNVSVLSKKLLQVEGGFYAMFSEEHHGYYPKDFTRIDQISNYRTFKKDCSFDDDLDLSKPLDISCDHSAGINLVVTGQPHEKEYRFVSGLHVLHPQLTKDVIQLWCDYYKPFPKKVVNYYYDHTSIGHSGIVVESYKDEVIKILKNNDWSVNERYIGQQPTHDSRYRFWARALEEKDPNLPVFRWNRTNCAKVIAALGLTRAKQDGKGIRKDKAPERDPEQDQSEAPHYTDACDNLAMYHRPYEFVPSGDWI